MNHSQLGMMSVLLILLILLSGFFSAAETGLMAINRYRLRHKARLKKRPAMLILNLLKRPDRLLGMILIGNCCANIFASSIATLMALTLYGEKAVFAASVLLTIAVLIFAEIAPKTFAANHPEGVSRWVAWPIFGLLKLFLPLVWLLNVISNTLLRLLGIKSKGQLIDPLTREELRSVVYETSGRISNQYQKMLLGILDLNEVTVDDVMVPKHDIIGIDLEKSLDEIQDQLSKYNYDWFPVFKENVNQAIGMLHVRELMEKCLHGKRFSKEDILLLLKEPYFIPEGASLNTQLIHFQRQSKRIALVVDEYGEVQGLITLKDILEEIFGEFTTVASEDQGFNIQSDGSLLVEGGLTIRELNRNAQLELPTQGPRTLSGLIIEYLEAIPKPGICLKIADYPIEVVEVKENCVIWARVFPRIHHPK